MKNSFDLVRRNTIAHSDTQFAVRRNEGMSSRHCLLCSDGHSHMHTNAIKHIRNVDRVLVPVAHMRAGIM